MEKGREKSKSETFLARSYVNLCVIPDKTVGFVIKSPCNAKPTVLLCFFHFPNQHIYQIIRRCINNFVKRKRFCNKEMASEVPDSTGIHGGDIGHTLSQFLLEWSPNATAVIHGRGQMEVPDQS